MQGLGVKPNNGDMIAHGVSAPAVPLRGGGRVAVDGKHLWLGGRPWRVRGVTYGGFVPRLDGEPFPERHRLKHDLTKIADAGLNTVRTYSLPPVEMLDFAEEVGLKILVGLHYPDWRMSKRVGGHTSRTVLDAGRRAVDEALDRCSGRECILALSVGNEVPGDVVRVHGIQAVEDVLSELVHEIHRADPALLTTYCNFPTTEYLRVDGQDLASFNVFLEHEESFKKYLRRLQIAAGDIPLLVTEVGLAAGIHGEDAQAAALSWQLTAVDECGAAGATVYAWTDEWGVAGEAVVGWGFGITTEERAPKKAVRVVERWADSSLSDLREEWPAISVVVCAYNEAATIGECLESLQRCEYPHLEVIVCDDGSTDQTRDIARSFGGFRLLELPHAGLSTARNAGIEAASAEIVVFLDADATCHPEWPYHLALALEDPNVGAAGGPNLPVEGARFVERAVAVSPGNPIHVLVDDDRAEHVPGCNMAFKKDVLGAVNWFDPVYRSAGDDVDVCWKLLETGYEIAFSPAAQVRHHRRGSIRGYLKQQRGYGKAERILWTRHPHRFNRLGQASWAGSIYGGPRVLARYLRPVVYHGLMGQAPFQGVVKRRSEIWLAWAQALLPMIVALGLVGGIIGVFWKPALVAAALSAVFVGAFASAVAAATQPWPTERHPVLHRLLVAGLHVAQPLIRAWGRVRNRAGGAQVPDPTSWEGDRIDWLMKLRDRLVARRCAIRWADPDQDWDLEASLGPLVAHKVTTAVVWGWTPQYRTGARLRLPGFAALGLALVLSLLGSLAGVAIVAVLAVWTPLEGWLGRRILKSSMNETTTGERDDADR